MYDPASIPPWPNAFDSLDGKPAAQRIKQRHWQTDRMSWADWQPLIATYFGEISLIDAQVGRLLGSLWLDPRPRSEARLTLLLDPRLGEAGRRGMLSYGLSRLAPACRMFDTNIRQAMSRSRSCCARQASGRNAAWFK